MKLIKTIDLPRQMRQGWGITHDYQKDFENISKVSEQVSKNEKVSVPESMSN